jgi:hypothetical protein
MYKCIILPADGFRAEGSAWQGVTLLVFGVTSDLSIVGSTKSEQKNSKMLIHQLLFVHNISCYING